ncbi:MAG TPA: 50S ribosomal protein L10 [Bacillota bacterium]|nr:50S ribosomal protein L10 [Clostridiales bacterium]HPT86045.1 50S ribosomal protein L10 [Bacillota bacterium]
MPSEKTLALKKAQCEALVGKLQTAVSGVIVNYQGITVEQDTQLRSEMRKAGVEYKVYKNTLTERAFDAVGFSELKPLLTGMNALAISQNDPVAPAKILKEYAEKIPTFEIKAGFVEGRILDQKGVLALAEIPSKETLVCKIMLSMQSPLYKLAYALQAIIDKSGEAPAEAAAEPAAE